MNLLLYMAPVVLLSLVPTTIILEPGALMSLRELAQQQQCECRAPLKPDPPLRSRHPQACCTSGLTHACLCLAEVTRHHLRQRQGSSCTLPFGRRLC